MARHSVCVTGKACDENGVGRKSVLRTRQERSCRGSPSCANATVEGAGMGMTVWQRAVCVLGSTVLGTVAALAADLAVDAGGHYLTYRGKPCVLVGDSGTHCVMQDANLDYRHWIDDCAEAGVNAVQVWAFVAPRQQLDGSVIEPRYGYVFPGITPWARKTEGPPATDGGHQWDLHRWDEGTTPDHYWPR